jgi:hypothetical protein
MKKIWLLLLLCPLLTVGQDWNLSTHNRGAWTFAGIDGRDTITDTSYQCTITKKGVNITFSHAVKGKLHVITVPWGEQANFPAKDHSEPFGIKNGEVCTVYYTNGQGVILYYPTKKKVIRMWPRNWKYSYY